MNHPSFHLQKLFSLFERRIHIIPRHIDISINLNTIPKFQYFLFSNSGILCNFSSIFQFSWMSSHTWSSLSRSIREIPQTRAQWSERTCIGDVELSDVHAECTAARLSPPLPTQCGDGTHMKAEEVPSERELRAEPPQDPCSPQDTRKQVIDLGTPDQMV